MCSRGCFLPLRRRWHRGLQPRSSLSRSWLSVTANKNVVDGHTGGPDPFSGPHSKPTSVLPTFSTDAFKTFVKSPRFATISVVLIRGASNPPNFTSDIVGLTPADFTDGALHAVEVVTNQLANTQEHSYRMLSDQLTRDCALRLEEGKLVADLPKDQARSVAINKEDVFLSWIHSAGVVKATGETEILLAVMAMPGLALMKQQVKSEAQKVEAFMEDAKRRQLGFREASEEMKEFRKTLADPIGDMRRSDFLVSNFRFVHRDGTWRMDLISMKPAKQLFLAPFYWRWKGRVGFHIRGIKFLSILRMDYATDYAWVFLFLLLVMRNSAAV